jgi:hypothetical protein
MSRVRSKRNFKSLQLDVVSTPQSPTEPDPVPIRQAPANKQVAGGAKKRPPPMVLKPKAPAGTPATTAADPSSAVDGFIAVAPAPSSAPASGTPSANAKRMTYHTTLSNTLASLDLNAEVKYDLRDEDLKDLHELGQGNGGSVKKVEHVPSHTIMAKKVCPPLRVPVTWHLSLATLVCSSSSGRSSSLTQNHLYESKSSASYRSCMIVTRDTSFPSTAHFYPIRTYASVWSSWTRVPSTGFTNK